MSYKSFAYDESLMITPPTTTKAIAIVEFRPLSSYDGKFGFDWFRVGDSGDNAFSSTITSNITDLEKEYKQFTILKANSPIHVTDDTYFVPYLNLYTKGRSVTVKTGQTPPFEAELQIKLTIEEELEKVEFEYNDRWFSISFNGVVQDTLPDTNLTPCAKRDSSVIKITCYNEKWDGFARNEEIKAWHIQREVLTRQTES